jgi:adenosine kinase
VSLSFLVDTMDKRRGGCAPNIAYTLALLGERPYLMATAGQDFGDYRAWLDAAGVDTSLVKQVDGKFTASFFCSTDQHNNQIRTRSTLGRWPTPPSCRSARPGVQAHHRLAERSAAMSQMRRGMPRPGIPFIYDFGQQVARLRRRAARRAHRRRRRDLERLRVPGPV